jgi:hypothetical protein
MVRARDFEVLPLGDGLCHGSLQRLEINFTTAGGAMAQEHSIRQQELEQKRPDWETHIASWRASRVSQAEYCRRYELKFHQFVYWRRKFAPKPNTPLSLVQVPVAAVARASGYFAQPAALRVALAPDVCIDDIPGTPYLIKGSSANYVWCPRNLKME